MEVITQEEKIMEYYSKKLLELQRQFDGTKYNLVLSDYCAAYIKKDTKQMDEIIKKFPTDLQLLENLVKKLKGKSVYSNLKRLIKGESIDTASQAISVSSLITHILIECKCNKEYKILLPDLYKKLGKLI